MRCHRFTTLWIFSFILFLVTIAIVIGGWSTYHVWAAGPPGDRWEVESCRGVVGLRRAVTMPGAWSFGSRLKIDVPGFAYDEGQESVFTEDDAGQRIYSESSHIEIGIWRLNLLLPLLLFSIPPLMAASRRWNRKRQTRLRAGLCVRCGYDLAGSPNRCPECGKLAAFKDGMQVG